MAIVRSRCLFVDAWDLSGHLKGIAFENQLELQDDTVLTDSARSNEPGLRNFTLQHEGVWAAGANQPDAILAAKLGLANVLATLAPVDGDEGEVAYFMRTTQGIYKTGGVVGGLLLFSVSLAASGGIGAVRGTLMVNGTKSSTGTGTARQLGQVSAAQSLYAGLHVLAKTGTSPTLDVSVRSDNAEGFGSPTTRITFAQKTDVGSEWATPVAGAISDDWWRIDWAIGGSASPTFQFVCAVGIQ